MRKIAVLVIIFVLLFSVSGDSVKNITSKSHEIKMHIPVIPSPILEPTPALNPASAPAPVPTLPYQDLWAKIDGSTATIPLSERLFRYYCGESKKMAITHNTTHTAYENLVSGQSDLIFVTPPSTEERKMLEDAPHEYDIIPVVKDAFVFLVNTENPVSNLSSAELRSIYAGDITEWSEVGGNKGEILAYQRPENSGSQTLFLDLFMKDTVPIIPPLGLVENGMGDLVGRIGNYDNSKHSLGYSVFYYASAMYANENVCLLTVDGVSPTKDSIAAGEYPLVSYYYAIFRKDLPENSDARGLVNFLLSDAGQRLAVEAGYVPLKPIADTVRAEIIPLFSGDTKNSSGTGGTEPIDELPPKKSQLSDLFYDGVNYIEFINDSLTSYFENISNDSGGPYSSIELKRPFTGIPNDYPHFSVDEFALEIHFLQNNPFIMPPFTHYVHINIPKDLTPYPFGKDDAVNYWEDDFDFIKLPRKTPEGIHYYLIVASPEEANNTIHKKFEKLIEDTVCGKKPEEITEVQTYIRYLRYNSDGIEWIPLLSGEVFFNDGRVKRCTLNMDTGALLSSAQIFKLLEESAKNNSYYRHYTNFSPENGLFEYRHLEDWLPAELSDTSFSKRLPKNGYDVTDLYFRSPWLVVEVTEPDGQKLMFLFEYFVPHYIDNSV